jgi:hypothetical protein
MYPAFRLHQEPIYIDGLLFVEGRVIDDTNVPKTTLGHRRLLSGHEMAPIRMVREDDIALIKDNGDNNWYLDYNGSVFKYRRTRQETIVSHKITKIIKKDFYSLVLLKDVNFPILVKRPPVELFARVLYYKGLPWKIYDYTNEAKKPVRKKV